MRIQILNSSKSMKHFTLPSLEAFVRAAEKLILLTKFANNSLTVLFNTLLHIKYITVIFVSPRKIHRWMPVTREAHKYR